MIQIQTCLSCLLLYDVRVATSFDSILQLTHLCIVNTCILSHASLCNHEHFPVMGCLHEPLLFDHGKNFLSLLIHEVCKLIGTKKMNTSSYYPQSDGLVEKFNSTLISMLSKSIRKYGQDGDKHLAISHTFSSPIVLLCKS